MRLIVLSDIHANLEALKAALDDASRAAPGCPVVCLGDLIGYGADPDEVVTLARGSGFACVMGNHEMGATRPRTRSRFNPQAWEAVRWAASRLSPDNLAWIAGLPAHLCLHGCRFVHGLPPSDVDTYLFQASTERVVKAMQSLPEDVAFVGHTHQLRLVCVEGDGLKGSKLPEGDTALPAGGRCIVNAGAVGQPRDGTYEAKYCIYDTASRVLTVRHVAYDNLAAAGRIIASGQPEAFARRLADLEP